MDVTRGMVTGCDVIHVKGASATFRPVSPVSWRYAVAVVWKIGAPITSTGFITNVEIYKEL